MLWEEVEKNLIIIDLEHLLVKKICQLALIFSSMCLADYKQ